MQRPLLLIVLSATAGKTAQSIQPGRGVFEVNPGDPVPVLRREARADYPVENGKVFSSQGKQMDGKRKVDTNFRLFVGPTD